MTEYTCRQADNSAAQLYNGNSYVQVHITVAIDAAEESDSLLPIYGL